MRRPGGAASNEECSILVLADGLGSGVKANILSTLTSKILCTMIEGGMPIEECIDTIAATLPGVQGAGGGLFHLHHHPGGAQQDGGADPVRQSGGDRVAGRPALRLSGDHPHRGGQDHPRKPLPRGGKRPVHRHERRRALRGVGTAFNYGWTRDNIIDFAEANYLPESSAKYVAGNIAEECNRLYGGPARGRHHHRRGAHSGPAVGEPGHRPPSTPTRTSR